MPCFRPITGVRDPDGKVRLREPGPLQSPVTIGCGACEGCRKRRSSDLAVRLMHHYRMIQAGGLPSWFVTLTCDSANEQGDAKAMSRELQLWIKRLRERVSPARFSYFRVAECGERTKRWHGHAALFGLDLADARPLRVLDPKCDSVTSRLIELSWGKGHVEVAPFNEARASYLSGYLVKGSKGDDREIAHWSRGLGESWWAKYGPTDVLPHGSITLRGGARRAIPTRYKRILKKEAPGLYAELIEGLKAGCASSWEHRVPARLEVMEEVAIAATKAADNRGL